MLMALLSYPTVSFMWLYYLHLNIYYLSISFFFCLFTDELHPHKNTVPSLWRVLVTRDSITKRDRTAITVKKCRVTMSKQRNDQLLENWLPKGTRWNKYTWKCKMLNRLRINVVVFGILVCLFIYFLGCAVKCWKWKLPSYVAEYSFSSIILEKRITCQYPVVWVLKK